MCYNTLMASKKRTNKSTFRSIYGEGFVAPAQYLTEALCFLVARQRKIDLPDKFWENDDWAKFFRHQIVLANKLLKEYDINAILSALKDWRIKNKIRSFGGKHILVPVIKEYQRKIDLEQAQEETTTPKLKTNETPRRPKGKKSIISILEDFEDNE